MNRLIVGLATTVLLSGSVVGVLPATATALPDHPVPLRSWPGCPEDNPSGPCHWCPGDPPVQTGNLRTNPVVWDSNVCHTYWYIYSGRATSPRTFLKVKHHRRLRRRRHRASTSARFRRGARNG
jgi:hypothetical protein